MLASIDKKDKKILREINLNSKESYGKIGKKTKLSKNQIAHRINRLIDKNIILKYVTLIDHSKLNYNRYRFYFELKYMNSEMKSKVINYLKSKNNTCKIAFLEGNYNLLIDTIHNNLSNVTKYFLDFDKKFSKYIHKKELNVIAFEYDLPNNYMYDDFLKHSLLVKEPDLKSKNKIHKDMVNDEDIKILNLLINDSRKSIIELSKSLNLSAKTIISKIKKMEKIKLINGYSVEINHSKFGFEQYIVSLNLDYENDKRIETKLIEFLKQQKNVIKILKPIGDYDLEFQCLFQDIYRLIDLIELIRNKYPTSIKSYNSTLTTNIQYINTTKFSLQS